MSESAFDPDEATVLATELRDDDARMTPGMWRAGSVETDSLFFPDPNGLAGPGGESVLLRMNKHFAGYPADCAGIARLRNNARAVADQLEAAVVEVEGLNEALIEHVEDAYLARAALAALRERLLPASQFNDDESATILARAHGIAKRLVAEHMDELTTPIDDLDDATVVSFGFGLLVGKLTEVRPVQPQLSRCGWCLAAAGGSDEAWLALPEFAIADIKAHTLACEHNPLVRELAELREAVAREGGGGAFFLSAWKSANRTIADLRVELAKERERTAGLLGAEVRL